MTILLPLQDFSNQATYDNWVAYNTNSVKNIETLVLDNAVTKTFLRIESIRDALSGSSFGLYSLTNFPITAGETYKLTFLYACHGNALDTMDYTYILTAGDTTVGNQRIVVNSTEVADFELYATQTTNFKLPVYKFSIIFTANYTDVTSRLLVGSKVSKTLPAGNYGLVYVADVQLEYPYGLERQLIDSLKQDWTPMDYYNFEDLNRVENAMTVVRDKIVLFRGEIVPLDEIFTDRTQETIEFADSLNRIETNLERLKLTFPDPSIFDISKTDWTHGKPFDFSDATRYERMLYEMFYTIDDNISNIPYCGQLIAGEQGVI